MFKNLKAELDSIMERDPAARSRLIMQEFTRMRAEIEKLSERISEIKKERDADI